MRILWRLLGCLLALGAASAQAQEIELYEGEVSVPGQSDAARDAALPQALAASLVRLTGRADVGSDPAVAAQLSRAPTLLRQFRYRQDADPSQPGASGTTLVARFDQAGVDALLAETGQRVWPSPRSVPVVWLAIDDGRGPRLLGSAQARVVGALTRRAAQRGLRLTYPLLDLEEQQQVGVAPFWAGDSAAARRASARYQSRVSLVGKLYRSGSGWTAEWVVYDGEQRLGETTRSAPEAPTVLAEGADLAADLLAARYAVSVADSGPAGKYPVSVSGLTSGADYARTLAYFQRLSVVREVRVLGAQGDVLELELDLRTGLGGLNQLVANGQTLVAQDDDADNGQFRLLP
ncbi:DUF2066 domain-containing protein [Pseudomarimonas salicorniae]|uniref:DUF2066 domain-containing protein n=1 Tax=Pseudomarimonas salicorniae TaxID=2933270 RepID=A0ABT0GGL0_9GAMM|nr:DUF2066 domain-containing protein [Lysobacter sp. CAU 1642]MCK7593677.1 DUF2066 domain-containing protein [Lysobacter sp. CAU 1642]